MPARCVVRLLQIRIAEACPSPPGHTRDIMALCGARNVHAHPVCPVRLAVWSRSPYKRRLATAQGFIDSATAQVVLRHSPQCAECRCQTATK